MATLRNVAHATKLRSKPQTYVLDDTLGEPTRNQGGSRACLSGQPTYRPSDPPFSGAASEGQNLAPERLLLRRLGVFFGGWTLEAATAVCSGGEVTKQDTASLLACLEEASLVTAEERDGTRRYSLPEERQARLRFEATEEAETLRRRHRDYFLQWAAQAGRTQKPTDPSLRPEKSVSEYANLWAALLWSRQQKETEATLLLASALSRLCLTRAKE